MKQSKQLFFRPDEHDEALKAARAQHRSLYVIVDRRSLRPKPRMYVLGIRALQKMKAAKMFKRMWDAREEY